MNNNSNTKKVLLPRYTLIFGTGHAIPAGLNFLLITISTFYLSPGDLGIIGLAEATAIIVAHLSSMALPGSLRRLFFNADTDESRRLLISSILRGGILIAIMGTAASMLLGPAIFNLIPADLPNFYPCFAYAIGYQIWYRFLEYRLTLFQITEHPILFAVLQILTGLTVFVFVFFFTVIMKGGASGFLLGRLVAVTLVTLMVIYGMRKHFYNGWSSDNFKMALKYSAPLIPHLLAITILNFADRFLLEVYSTTAEVGLYTLAYTLGLAMHLVTIAFSMSWGPFFFQTANAGKEHYGKIYDLAGKAVAISTAIAIFGVMISRDFVTLVFAEEYHPAASIVPLIIAGYLLFFLYSMFSHSVLHEKKTHYIALITMLTAAVNIVLNIWLIPNYGMAGAAWATIISFGLQTLTTYIIAVRILPATYPIGKILFILGIFSVILVMTQCDGVGRYIFYLSATVAMLAVLKISFTLPDWPWKTY